MKYAIEMLIEQHYSLREAIDACWKMVGKTGESWLILEHRDKMADGGRRYGVIPGYLNVSSAQWGTFWTVICVRDPADWAKA